MSSMNSFIFSYRRTHHRHKNLLDLSKMAYCSSPKNNQTLLHVPSITKNAVGWSTGFLSSTISCQSTFWILDTRSSHLKPMRSNGCRDYRVCWSPVPRTTDNGTTMVAMLKFDRQTKLLWLIAWYRSSLFLWSHRFQQHAGTNTCFWWRTF